MPVVGKKVKTIKASPDGVYLVGDRLRKELENYELLIECAKEDLLPVERFQLHNLKWHVDNANFAVRSIIQKLDGSLRCEVSVAEVMYGDNVPRELEVLRGIQHWWEQCGE